MRRWLGFWPGGVPGRLSLCIGLLACARRQPARPAAAGAAALELRPILVRRDVRLGVRTTRARRSPRSVAPASSWPSRTRRPRWPPSPLFGQAGDWQSVCADAAARSPSPRRIRRAPSSRTASPPIVVADGDDPEGLFTGYYEPLLNGSRHFGGRVYGAALSCRRPISCASTSAGSTRNWPATRSTAAIAGASSCPTTRAREIDSGALAGRGLELLWVDDPVDKFFLQVQGSGQVRLDDGSLIRVGYAGQNGQPYRAIGRDLIEMRRAHAGAGVHAGDPRLAGGASERRGRGSWSATAPTSSSRNGPSWRPTRGRSAPRACRSPPGARSPSIRATSRSACRSGWTPPRRGRRATAPLRRLMVAQDAGGAIKGVVRGDVFWGAGERAAAIAGRMKSRGRYAVLLPKALIPVS